MTRETKMVELVKQEHTSEEGKKDENLILLLLSSDLRDRYMKTLVDRLINIGVVVAIEEIDYPKEKKEKYEWILNFSGNIPKGKSVDLKNSKLIFRVLGKAELKKDKLDSGDSEKLAKIPLSSIFFAKSNQVDMSCTGLVV